MMNKESRLVKHASVLHAMNKSGVKHTCVVTFKAHFTHMSKSAPRETTTAPSLCSSAHDQHRIFRFSLRFFLIDAVCARDCQAGCYDQDDKNEHHEPDDEAVAVH